MKIKVGVIGGSGYTGIELIKLLIAHPYVDIVAISSRSLQGKNISEVFPSLIGCTELKYHNIDDPILNTCDVIFFATPHGVAMNNVRAFIEKGIKIIDLGADFRIKDSVNWSQWYDMEHTEKEMLSEAIYGLPEIYRNKIKDAKLIANPGCYPTAVLLALKPLLENKLIDCSNIIADCKSGASGAGRSTNQSMMFCEVTESFKAYGVSGHRHFPEIKQELETMAGEDVNFTFVPHLLPMIRGIEATIYVDLLDNEIDVRPYFEKAYKNEKFVKILKDGVYPETRSVKSSNYCQIGIQKVTHSNKLVVMSVIDNLIKGASGQAIHNMNLIFGFEEKTGLSQIGMLP